MRIRSYATFRAAILTLALPAALAAQQTPAAPSANPITTALKARTLGLQRNIAHAFDSIPASKFSDSRTPAELAIRSLVQSLTNDDYLFCNLFGDQKAVRERGTSTPDSVKATPIDTLLARLKASFTFCEDELAQVDDSKLSDLVAVSFGGPPPPPVTRVWAVLSHALNLATHDAQIAVYARLNFYR